MKDVLKNKKGFTLVELLAVIVVLAIIILIALPAVLNAMEKARKNSFIVEATETVKIAQTAYSDAIMNGKTGNVFCVPYKYLVDGGFVDKKDSTGYEGSVLITITPGSQKATYKIWFKNSNYKLIGLTYEQIDSSKIGEGTDPTNWENCGGTSGATTLSLPTSGS